MSHGRRKGRFLTDEPLPPDDPVFQDGWSVYTRWQQSTQPPAPRESARREEKQSADDSERVALVGGIHPPRDVTLWVLVGRNGSHTSDPRTARLYESTPAGKEAALRDGAALESQLEFGWPAFAARVFVRGDWDGPDEVTPAWVLREGLPTPVFEASDDDEPMIDPSEEEREERAARWHETVGRNRGLRLRVLMRFLISVGEDPDLELERVPKGLDALRNDDMINRLGRSDWERIANGRHIDDLVALTKALTICEERFRWLLGSVSPIIWLYRAIQRVDPARADELADWVLARTSNAYAPFGSLNHGARSLREYRRLEEAG